MQWKTDHKGKVPENAPEANRDTPDPGPTPQPAPGSGVPGAPGPTLAALRAATAPLHDAVHHHPLMAPLASGHPSAEAYARVLGAFLAFHRAVEGRLLAPAAADLRTLGLERAPRLPQIEADLAALETDGVARPADPGDAEDLMPTAPDLPEVLGVLYVMEGSRLGGLGLAAQVEKDFDSPASRATRFLRSADRAVPPLWRRLCSLIEESGAHPQQRQRITAAARATFGALIQWLDRVHHGTAGADGP